MSDGRDENVVDTEVGDSRVATLQLQNRHSSLIKCAC